MKVMQLDTTRGSFAVRHHGESGPVVLCVHGFPDDASTYDGLAGSLVETGYRVAAVNLRGYAPSPLEGPLGLDDLVADLFAMIDELSPDAPVALVGHDYGAAGPASRHEVTRGIYSAAGTATWAWVRPVTAVR